MKERTYKRQLIHVLSRHSNWHEEGIEQSLWSENVYAGRKDWIQFLNYFLIGLGASFLVAGVIFFFAFNWDSLHKFVKLGVIQTLIVLCGAWILFGAGNELTKKIILTVMSCLAGVLFAVFGQIYQTGADDADFFLAWTMFIALWALVSNFPPLWLIFLVLLQITLFSHSYQILEELTDSKPYTILFGLNKTVSLGNDMIYLILAGLNILVVVKTEWLYHKGWLKNRASWFICVVALTAIIMLTLVISMGMYKEYSPGFQMAVVLGAVSYAAGIYYGFVTRNVFYLSSTGFSIIIILTALIIKPFEDPIGIFFLAGLFIVITTTFLIREIFRLNKKWYAE